ncbi:hypothetical protein HK097_005729, partial [Rhizophlyctis rosea]
QPQQTHPHATPPPPRMPGQPGGMVYPPPPPPPHQMHAHPHSAPPLQHPHAPVPGHPYVYVGGPVQHGPPQGIPVGVGSGGYPPRVYA